MLDAFSSLVRKACDAMALFLSTYKNRLDKKGRLSIPAPYRAVIAKGEFAGVVAYGSFVNPCIEACDIARIEKLSESIDNLDPYSDERDAFATAILGGASQLSFDGEGRISLPDGLIETAGLEQEAMIVGKGKTFEIWKPETFADYAAKARDLAKQARGSLQLSNPKPAGV